MRLLEPLGLLHGPAARAAIEAGHALPLAGGAFACALLRLDDGAVVPANAVPAGWRDAAARLAAPPAPWAGLPDRPLVMGVVNATPDSFSDGGDHLDPAAAIAAGRAMAAAGADVVDVGGETTRPGAAPTPPAVEQARVLPVVRALAAAGVVVSVDTRNASTMAAALDAGAAIVNDVSALAHDPDAAALVARRNCPVVLMHMRGDPATMTRLAAYDDVAAEVTRELAARVDAAVAAGVRRERIAVDPGIGFAKTPAQNPALLRRLPLLLNLGCRVLVGASRKRFLRQIAGVDAPKATGPASLAAALFALDRGASLLRVHDVAETAQAVRVWQALRG